MNIKTTVDVSLLHVAFFGGMSCTRVDRYQAPPTPSLVLWVAAARVCEALWSWVFVVRGSGHLCVERHLTVTIRLKRCGQSKVPQAMEERHVPSLRAMEESLHGTIWYMISPLLTTDDAVRCRTVARRWNVGSRCGEMGEMFFQLLHNDPFAKHWFYDSEWNKLCTVVEVGPSWSRASGNSAAVTAAVKSAGEGRPPGIAKYGAMKESELSTQAVRLPLLVSPRGLHQRFAREFGYSVQSKLYEQRRRCSRRKACWGSSPSRSCSRVPRRTAVTADAVLVDGDRLRWAIPAGVGCASQSGIAGEEVEGVSLWPVSFVSFKWKVSLNCFNVQS